MDDLLDVSRITAGKFELEVRRIDLSEVVHDAAEMVREAAASKGITLSMSLQPRIAVRGDAARLRQVVVNLVGNAVKFTPEGGKVSVELLQLQNGTELTVRDNGIGIEPDFLPHVFERFRQADSSASRERGGLGLGLSIVASIVDAHGGRVHAESAGPGAGATFTVTLPPCNERTVVPSPETGRLLAPAAFRRSARLES